MARYLIIQFIAQSVIFVILVGVILSKTRSIAGLDVFTGCLLSLPNGYYLSWILLLVCETILVILAVYKCRQYGDFSPTTKIIARDSIVYFVSVTAMLIFNIFFTRSHILLGTILTLPTNICASIAAARLTMNIRSITMGQALETLAQESRIVTGTAVMFHGDESISYRMGEDSEPPFRDVTESEELPQHDHFLQ